MMGVNSRAELAAAEAAMQTRCARRADAGVGMIAPETVFLSYDTKLEAELPDRTLCRVRPRRHGGRAARKSAPSRIWKAPKSAAARSSGPMRGCVPARRSAKVRISAISSR